jgi:hypothetical protein
VHRRALLDGAGEAQAGDLEMIAERIVELH